MGHQQLYNSLQFRFTKRFSQGLQFQGSYAFGKNLDMVSGIAGGDVGGSAAATQDPFDQVRSKGRSGFHVSNRFTANFTADIPSGDLSGAARAVLGGWQVSGIITAADGNPVNLVVSGDQARLRLSRPAEQSPNLKPGADNDPFLGDPRQFWSPDSFERAPVGTLGNLGRNTATTPGMANFDFSLMKNFNVAEEASVQFRAEFFNIFNRTNFGVPTRTTTSSSFGRIRSTNTTSRQIQLGLKVLF